MLPADSLLSAAADYLRRVAACPDVVVVETVTAAGQRLRITGAVLPPQEAEPMPDKPNGVPPAWRFFSPAEEAILRATSAGWRTRDELAAASGVLTAGLASRNDFEAILRNLVERGVLESSPKGFRRAGDGPSP